MVARYRTQAKGVAEGLDRLAGFLDNKETLQAIADLLPRKSEPGAQPLYLNICVDGLIGKRACLAFNDDGSITFTVDW